MKERAEIGGKLEKARAQVESLKEKLEAAEKTCRMVDFQYSGIKTEEEAIGGKTYLSRMGLYGEERLLCRDRQKYQEMMNDGRGSDYISLDDNGEFIQVKRNVDEGGISIEYRNPVPVVDEPVALKPENIVLEPYPA